MKSGWNVMSGPEISSIVSDQGRLRQVLYTFLAWAVSRSSEGNLVKVRLELSGPHLNIQIEDQGEPVEDIARVFDPEETPRAGKTDLNELGIIIGPTFAGSDEGQRESAGA